LWRTTVGGGKKGRKKKNSIKIHGVQNIKPGVGSEFWKKGRGHRGWWWDERRPDERKGQNPFKKKTILYEGKRGNPSGDDELGNDDAQQNKRRQYRSDWEVTDCGVGSENIGKEFQQLKRITVVPRTKV